MTPPPHAAASRALSRGDALTALGLLGRAADALGLMLRGIAYAQLGDYDLARKSLAQGARLTRAPLARARIRAALAEISVSDGAPAAAARAARAAADELARLGDAPNAAMQRLLLARAEVLCGRLAEARHVVVEVLSDATLAPALRAVAWLAKAEIAVRAALAFDAREALRQARHAMVAAPNEPTASIEGCRHLT